MSYHTTQGKTEIFIDVTQLPAAAAALKAMAIAEGWFDTPPDETQETQDLLIDILEIGHLIPKFDAAGNLIDLFRDEQCDMEDVLEALAPFMRAGSFIRMTDQDGDAWVWEFKNQTMSRRDLQ